MENNINNNNQKMDVYKFIKGIKEGNIEYISSSISKDNKEYQYIKSSIDNTLNFYPIITNKVKNYFLEHIIFILSTSEDSNKYKEYIIKLSNYKDTTLMSFIDRLDFYRNNNFFNIEYVITEAEDLKEYDSEYKQYLFDIFSIIENIKYDINNSLDYIKIFEKLEDLYYKIYKDDCCEISSFIDEFLNKVFKTSEFETIVNEDIMDKTLKKIYNDLLNLSHSVYFQYNEFNSKTNKYILSIISDIYGYTEFILPCHSDDYRVNFYYIKILNNTVNYLKELITDKECFESFSNKTSNSILDILHYSSIELNKVK